ELEKGPLMAKAGAALALAAVNPLAALLPLLEPGPGVSTDCAGVLQEVKPAESNAVAKAGGKSAPPPAQPAAQNAERQPLPRRASGGPRASGA
ncbi:MAG TPA: hypothetical protein VN667_18870, partial [Burkholderiales bacterium]|nr:hypothetical protein [Burkholderiales bacterium]